MKLEVVVLGVSDIDRAKAFYENLGWRLDGDFTAGDDFRIAQMTVLSGAIRSQVDDEPVRVYRPGEAWFERPGSYHRVSEKASDTEPARLLAVLIVDAADKQLVILDPQ